MDNVITNAVFFGITKHGKQVRKYSGIPYFTHCCEVAQIVSQVCTHPDVIAAAYLHDVLEDTDATYAEIVEQVGEEPANLVRWLTNEPVVQGVNRDRRKAMDRERLSRAPWAVHTIKLADLISNAPSIRDNDPAFALRYGQDARKLVPALALGDLHLRGRVLEILSTLPG